MNLLIFFWLLLASFCWLFSKSLLHAREVAMPLAPRVFIHEGTGFAGRTSCIYTRGKPTRLAPRPKPAPWRAVTAMAGVKVSRTAKVAKAAVPMVRISPKLGFLGFSTSRATKATTRPSIRYLRTEVKRSPTEKSILYLSPRFFVRKIL